MKKAAVALMSGGLDSSTALWKLKDSYGEITALTFDYGAKDSDTALHASKKISLLAGANHRTIELPWLEEFSRRAGSTLVTEEKVPQPEEDELDDMVNAKETARSVWIPARNLVFLSIAASLAEGLEGGADIIAGFDREEAQTFPDNSKEFVERMNNIFKLGVLKGNVKIMTPLIDMDKSEIAALARSISLPIEYTSSCYEPLGLDKGGRPIHCGRCESCKRRHRGLESTGTDPTIYGE